MDKSDKRDEDFRATFLQSLKAREEELLETLSSLVLSQKEYDGELHLGDFKDEVDDALREISSHRISGLLERKNQELRNIKRLIERISKEEDFGLCEECGDRIPKERLLVIPEATLCVPCQQALERRHHAMSAPSGGLRGGMDSDWDRSNDSAEDEDDLIPSFDDLSLEEEKENGIRKDPGSETYRS